MVEMKIEMIEMGIEEDMPGFSSYMCEARGGWGAVQVSLKFDT